MAYYWKGRSDVLITRFLLVNKRRWRIHSSGTCVFISTFKLCLPLNLWTPNYDMMWTTPKMHQYHTQERQQLEFGDTARGQKCATYCFQVNIVWTELYLDMTDQSIYLSRSYQVSGKRNLEPSCLIRPSSVLFLPLHTDMTLQHQCRRLTGRELIWYPQLWGPLDSLFT